MLDLPSTLLIDSSPQELKERSARSTAGLPLLCLGVVIVLGSVALMIFSHVAADRGRTAVARRLLSFCAD